MADRQIREDEITSRSRTVQVGHASNGRAGQNREAWGRGRCTTWRNGAGILETGVEEEVGVVGKRNFLVVLEDAQLDNRRRIDRATISARLCAATTGTGALGLLDHLQIVANLPSILGGANGTALGLVGDGNSGGHGEAWVAAGTGQRVAWHWSGCESKSRDWLAPLARWGRQGRHLRLGANNWMRSSEQTRQLQNQPRNKGDLDLSAQVGARLTCVQPRGRRSARTELLANPNPTGRAFQQCCRRSEQKGTHLAGKRRQNKETGVALRKGRRAEALELGRAEEGRRGPGAVTMAGVVRARLASPTGRSRRDGGA